MYINMCDNEIGGDSGQITDIIKKSTINTTGMTYVTVQ